MGVVERQCTVCRVVKPAADFYRAPTKAGILAKCKVCNRQAVRRWEQRHPGIHRRRYWANRDAERERHIKAKYGMSFKDYERLAEAQGRKCAICASPEPSGRLLNIDHDHQTGKVRGLLCASCNRGIGLLGDSSERVAAAARYLASSRKSAPSSPAASASLPAAMSEDMRHDAGNALDCTPLPARLRAAAKLYQWLHGLLHEAAAALETRP